MISRNSAEEENARHAALALHAVSQADRSWLLEQLPRSACEQLEPLLHELAALGIPCDPRFVSHVVRPDSNRGGLAELLQPGNAVCIAKIVSGEPTRLAACVAWLGDSRWRAAFVAQLPKDVREEMVGTYGDASTACPPRLAEALLAHVSLRLNARIPNPLARRSTWVRRVLGALRLRAA